MQTAIHAARRASALALAASTQKFSARPYVLSGAVAAFVLTQDNTAHQQAEASRQNNKSSGVVELDGYALSTEDLYELSKGGKKIRLSQGAYDRVMEGRNVVDSIVRTDEVEKLNT